MPQVSDLFKFSNLSDRKQFVIVIVAIVLYFGYRDNIKEDDCGKVAKEWEKLYNKETEKYDELREKYDARLDKDIMKAETTKHFRDTISLMLKQIKSQKESK